MDFKEPKGIFQQICESMCEKILSGVYSAGERVPSVRELAIDLGVNQNTIVRSYAELQNHDVIENRRGIGYFVTNHAPTQILAMRKAEFLQYELPEFIRQVQLLKMTKDELQSLWQLFSDDL